MNIQRSDIIAAQNRTDSMPDCCQECGNDLDNPYSCYCDSCENKILSEEIAFFDEGA